MSSIHASLARHRFIRTTDDRILGGVCSGLAKRFGVDPWAIRVLFLVSLVVIPGSQIILYPIAWLVMPDQERAAQVASAALPAPTGAPVVGPSAPVVTQPGAAQPGATQADSGPRLTKQA